MGIVLVLGQKPDEYGEVHPTAKWLSQALLAGYMLFTNILLLNLLIAIFRYSYVSFILNAALVFYKILDCSTGRSSVAYIFIREI